MVLQHHFRTHFLLLWRIMSSEPVTVAYGEDKDQWIRIRNYLNIEDGNRRPVVVIIHGGFWKQKYTADNALIDNLVPFFINQGFATCEVEYRRGRVDGGTGGWPMTNQDINAALIKLHEFSTEKHCIETSRAVILGHSAGGTLALWCCSHVGLFDFEKLPFTPALCVGVSPIGDLAYGEELKLSDEGDAISNYMGCQPQPPLTDGSLDDSCPYTNASPSNLLPIKTNCLLVAGSKDVDVPAHAVEKFYAQCAAKRSADHALELLMVEGDHYEVVTANSAAWCSIYEKIVSML